VQFTIEVDEQVILAQIDDAIARAKPDDAKVFVTSAKYYFDHGHSPEKALAWLDKSIAIQDTYQARELKGRLAERAGNKAEAVAQIEKALELAKGKASASTVDTLTKLLATLKAK
jgi:tetratricopeptide (TPR) repeat protein